MSEPNYQESAVSGTSWKRACRIFVENPLNGAPSLMIVEEEAIVLGDKTITNVCANLNIQFDPANAEHMAAYSVLNNLYIAARESRDAAVLAAKAEVPVGPAVTP